MTGQRPGPENNSILRSGFVPAVESPHLRLGRDTRILHPVDQTELDEIRIDWPKPEAGRVRRHLPPVMAAVRYQMKQDVSHW